MTNKKIFEGKMVFNQSSESWDLENESKIIEDIIEVIDSQIDYIGQQIENGNGKKIKIILEVIE